MKTKHKKIDITMTATVRPDLLKETLTSFCEKMLVQNERYRLIINVDPIGETVKAGKITKRAKRFFPNIVFNLPTEPGFTKAVIWCWQQVEADYVFHIEDDWRLLNHININDMIEILDKYPQLASLRLNKNKTRKTKTAKHGFVYFPKISLNPTLFKGEFIKKVVPLMTESLNPEKQLRINNSPRGKYISQWNHGIYTKVSYNRMVLDIGRKWMNKSKYTKKTGFMNWTKK